MKDNKKLYSIALVSLVMILMLVSIAGAISVEIGPEGVAVTPDGTKVYVANSGNVSDIGSSGNTTSVIDTATNTVTAMVPVGIGPLGVAVTPDGTKVYVTNFWSKTTSVIDTASNTVTATVPVGWGPAGAAVSPDGRKVYVANSLGNTTSVIDTTKNTVITAVPVGIYPSGVTVSLDGTKVFVASAITNNVSVIDTANNTVISTVNLGNEPFAFGKFRDSTYVPMPIQEALKKDSGSPQASGSSADNNKNTKLVDGSGDISKYCTWEARTTRTIGEYYKAPENKIYVVVTVKIDNTGDQTYSTNSGYWHLKIGDMYYQYDVSTYDSSLNHMTADIGPGGKITTKVAYLVDGNPSVSDLSLYYDGPGSDGIIYS